ILLSASAAFAQDPSQTPPRRSAGYSPYGYTANTGYSSGYGTGYGTGTGYGWSPASGWGYGGGCRPGYIVGYPGFGSLGGAGCGSYGWGGYYGGSPGYGGGDPWQEHLPAAGTAAAGPAPASERSPGALSSRELQEG